METLEWTEEGKWICPVCAMSCNAEWLVCPVCDYERGPDERPQEAKPGPAYPCPTSNSLT
jgi:hypothetical protein